MKETKYEFLKLLRTRSFSIATIGFPVMFYLLFGIANKHLVAGDIQIAKYMMAGYACFGLIGAALFGIGVGMAGEINAGWLEVKRASPMPPVACLFAKCVTAIALGLIINSVLITLGVTLGKVSITPSEVAMMLALAVPGSIVFASMGLLLAQVIPANPAPGIVNIIYLPMSFLGGLWIPFSQLPHWVRPIASVMPTYHLSQLMLGVFGRGYRFDDVSTQTHWLSLIGFACLMLGSAWAVFSRKQQRS
ncbi:ABC transporter permease [Edaphobacter sp. HDX4]|uniref:ABC transporter permease n=1 Tax=Edaphobacter sp. HDX4 TaxID=2794064 RepID=UPI003FA53BE5